MGENGYGATTLDAIVERAGCSKPAVYEYFGHKQGLISALAVELTRKTTMSGVKPLAVDDCPDPELKAVFRHFEETREGVGARRSQRHEPGPWA